MSAAASQRTTPRTGRKVEQVVDGARTVFLRDGFEGASVDAIAREAGVSKATLYSYFPDKRVLFMEVGRQECENQAGLALGTIDHGATPGEVLGHMGGMLVRFMTSPFGQNIFRICVAEADRFPELGRRFYESGPLVVRGHVVAYLEAACARGELVIRDHALAAEQFFELCKVDLFPRMVFGVSGAPTEDEIDYVVGEAVTTFLARYGARPSVDAPNE